MKKTLLATLLVAGSLMLSPFTSQAGHVDPTDIVLKVEKSKDAQGNNVTTTYYRSKNRVNGVYVFHSVAVTHWQGTPVGVPLDGGVSLLIAAGLGLGAKRARDKRKAEKANLA